VSARIARQSVPLLLSVALLAFLLATNIYRARTQSITIDEAYTYNHFVKTPHNPATTGPFNVNLNMLLARISSRAFGASEFSLRLPSVLAGLVYFYAVLQLCRLLFGDSPWLLLAVALNCLNPYVLDYLSAARGYGMGIACWMLGTYYVARWVLEGTGAGLAPAENTQLIKAGMAFGLSVASHISEIFAVASLEAAFVLIFLGDRLAVRDFRGAFRFVTRDVAQLCLTTALFASAILWVPLQYFQQGAIDGVVDRYKNGIRALVSAFVLYKKTILNEWDGWQGILFRLSWWLLVALLAGLAIAAAQILHRWSRTGALSELKPPDRFLLLLSITLLLTFFLLWIEPQIFHHDYWSERRLLFTLPLVFTACTLWLRWLFEQGKLHRAVAYTGMTLVLFLVCNFVLEFNVESYYGWQFDAAAKKVALMIRERHSREPKRPVKVGVSTLMSESLNFYRLVLPMDWMAEVTRDSPECYFDYYYVESWDFEGLKRFGLQELYRDPVAGTVLAEPGAAMRQRLVALHEAGFSGLPPCRADLTSHESWVAAGEPGAAGHMLRDVMEGREKDHQLWTYERPAMLFDVSDRTRPRFRLNLRLPIATFQKAGPTRLTVWINGRRLGEELYRSAEDHTFEQPVPPEWIRADGLTLVETTLDKYYIAPDDQRKLGYLFVSGGFVN
jgi:hypothetical protein